MFRVKNLAVLSALLVGALLGWLGASGRLVQLAGAREKQGQAAAKGGAGLSPILPPPEAPFDGTIGRTYKDSKPSKIPVVKAPAGAPNVLVILIDDCGFGQWGTFGGQIPTPNLDRLAKNGLKYTRFHTTALCSPTRAALLTGRNHHSAATGCITGLGSSFPGYTGQVPRSCAMASEIVRQNGYSTAFFGKNHNIADRETSISGPFDRWPNMHGFDHFYGLAVGEANQWQPALYDGTTPVEMEVPRVARRTTPSTSTWRTRPSITCAGRSQSRRTGRSSSATPPAARTPRTPSP